MSDPDTRREFLQRSGGCFLLAFCALALGDEASALPRVEVTGAPQGNERRYPLPAADTVNIDLREQVILVRNQGQVFALALACPHEHAAVRWVEQAKRFQCSKHNSRYEPDGRYTSGRATRNLDRFPIRREGAAVLIDVSHVWQADKNPTEWTAAAVPAA